MKKSISIITLASLILTSVFGVMLAQPAYADTNTQPFTVKVGNPNSVRVKITDPADKKQFSSKDLIAFIRACSNEGAIAITSPVAFI